MTRLLGLSAGNPGGSVEIVAEKLRQLQIQRVRNLLQRLQRRHRVPVLHPRQITPQQTRPLLDVPLRHTLL